jgi:hypothetical protein
MKLRPATRILSEQGGWPFSLIGGVVEVRLNPSPLQGGAPRSYAGSNPAAFTERSNHASTVINDRADVNREPQLTPRFRLQPSAVSRAEQNPQLSKNDLINEQERIMAQLEETTELIRTREATLIRIREEIAQQQSRRKKLGEDLDFLSSSFISDKASGIAELSARRAALRSDIDRYRDYLRLFSRMESLSTAKAKLEGERERLEAQLDDASSKKQSAENNIKKLEANFQRILQRVSLPQFLNPKNAFIDRTTYMPVVDGRKFENLSSPGLEIFVNFAHALAHHETALELGLNLPGLLFIDGLTSNIGKEGFDQQRVDNAYDYLIEVSDKYSSQLQIILADGHVPPQANPFVRLRLSEDDRLVPIPQDVVKKPPTQENSGISAESSGTRKMKRP